MKKLQAAVFMMAGLFLYTFSVPVVAADDERGESEFKAELSGYSEVVPPNTGAVHSAGTGSFKAHLRNDSLQYELNYSFPTGTAVQQAHIHFGLPSTVGGIMVFLCTNLGNDATGVAPACPTPSGSVTGTLTAAQVRAIAGQGFPAGDFAAFIAALQNEAAYVNVHTAVFPSGEIRGAVE